MMEGIEATSSSQRNRLPDDFVLTAHECVLGRGKKHLSHSGNIQFRRLIESQKFAYSLATSKKDKTKLLMAILNTQRSNSPSRIGFVRQDSSGHWYSVEDAEARVFIAQSLRDCLHSSYRSSKQFKQSKRQKEKTTGDNANESDCECIHQRFMEENTMMNATVGPSHLQGVLGQAKGCIVSEKAVQEDNSLFDSLFQAFGGESSQDINPFEPTPLSIMSDDQAKPTESTNLPGFTTPHFRGYSFIMSKEDPVAPDSFLSLCAMV